MSESLRLAFGDQLASPVPTAAVEDISPHKIYVNLRRLGTGGSAETYLVLATSGPLRGLQFAAKIFRRLSKPEWRTSFLEESSFLRTCSHPAVMRVFDEGIYREEHPFVVAEFLPQTLSSAMRKRTTFSDKLSYALQLFSALEYLASLDTPVVHRDIKPTNIFIKGGSCVLGDFGLMKHLVANPSLDREFLQESTKGMPRNYRTPDLVEYLKGGPLPTSKSDVFQTGLVLAELFTGSNPLQPIAADDFDAPIALDPLGNVDDPLWEHVKVGIQWMLAINPGDRPAPDAMLDLWREDFLAAVKRDRARARRTS
jgi:eukaryotic-like serine/threonine-protein kinase